MDMVELFKNSFKYPLKDANKLLFLGAVFIIGGLLTAILGIFNIALTFDITSNYFLATRIAGIAMLIILFIISAIISGYGISIIRKTLFHPEKVPSIELSKNLLSGLKLAILSLVYYLIPIAISLVISILNGTFNFIIKTMYFSIIQIFVNPNIIYPCVNVSGSGMSVIFIVGFFLSLVSTLLLIVATSRLAETNSLKEALKIDEVFKDISKIGVSNYIVWAVLYFIIGIFISILSTVIMIIPLIGIIVGYLIIMPYVTMFSARAIGLIYDESKSIL